MCSALRWRSQNMHILEKAAARMLKVVRSGRKPAATISRNARCRDFILKLAAKERR
uniref:Uncharacterized protein n=1 Tax=Arundo donax TaxID=35708 RepID=A0A0A9F3P9_ARUDO